MLTSKFAFKEEINKRTDEELVKEFKEIVKQIKVSYRIIDYYEPLLIPIFDCVKDKMDRDEFINIVKEIIQLCQTSSDKIAFYNYLISDCG